MHEKDGEYKIPLSDGKLEPISLSNRIARKVVKNSELLFDLVLENHPVVCVRRNMFKDCITDKLASITEKLRYRVNFTDDGIIELQRKIDIFYDLWFKLCGKNVLTNYIHLFRSGRVMYYLKKDRNLYRSFNQVW